MKKKLLILVIGLIIFIPNICNAKVMDYDNYKRLNIKYSFIVGSYLFNMDNGYSPTLEDIMIASRSISETQPTTLYEVRLFPVWDYFTINEIYKKTTSNDKSILNDMNIKYIYRNSINKSTSKDYDILS